MFFINLSVEDDVRPEIGFGYVSAKGQVQKIAVGKNHTTGIQYACATLDGMPCSMGTMFPNLDMENSVRKMQHRTEIDGLRAIAVIPVILFHAGFDTFSGGFIGVDVFFVISGFLITSLILRDLENQRFSLLDFYERRARRILPALFLVMLVCLPIAWLTMVPFQLKDFSQSLVAVVGFVSNILFYVESGYFEPDAELKPLLHTWSLAIEEQFYIVFPLLMLLLWRIRDQFGTGLKKNITNELFSNPNGASANWLLIAICVLMTLSSLGWSQWSAVYSPSAAFFLLPSRGWELLFGSLAALYLSRSSLKLSHGAEQILSSIGMIGIVTPIFIYDSLTLFPGFNALVPVVGVVLVLLFASDRTFVHRILSHRVLVGIGLVSYSAYLWHQPLIAFMRLHFGLDLSLPLTICALAATVFLSILSWRYVETPARRSAVVRFRYLVAVFLIAGGVIGVFAVSGLKSNGFYETKLASMPSEFRRFVVDHDAESSRLSTVVQKYRHKRSEPFDQTSADLKVLIVGDSIANDLYHSLMIKEQSFSGYQFRRLRLDDLCVNAATAVLQKKDKPIGTSESCRLEVADFLDNPFFEKADEVVLHTNFQTFNVDTAGPFVREMVNMGKKVSVVGLLVFNDISSVSMKLHRSKDSPGEVFYNALRSKYLLVNNSLEAQANELTDVRYLDKLSMFCFISKKRCNILSEEGSHFFIDGNHMTVAGYIAFGNMIDKALWFTTQ